MPLAFTTKGGINVIEGIAGSFTTKDAIIQVGSVEIVNSVIPSRRRRKGKKMIFEGKYGQAQSFPIELFEPLGIDFITPAFATGDVQISRNGAAFVNTANLPTATGDGLELTLTALEKTAARIKVRFVDQTGTKVWLDDSITITTYGHTSAEHEFDRDVVLTDATIRAEMDSNSSQLAAILLDTSTTLDAKVDAIKADTAATLIDTSTTLDAKIDAVKVDTIAILVDTGTTLDAAIAAIQTDTTAILQDTGTTLDGKVDAIQADLSNTTDGLGALKTLLDSTSTTIGVAGSGLTALGGLSTTALADILVEINKAFDAPIPELPVGAPPATPSIRVANMLAYMALRNMVITKTTGNDELQIHNDAGVLVAIKALNDDGTKYTESKMV